MHAGFSSRLQLAGVVPANQPRLQGLAFFVVWGVGFQGLGFRAYGLGFKV